VVARGEDNEDEVDTHDAITKAGKDADTGTETDSTMG